MTRGASLDHLMRAIADVRTLSDESIPTDDGFDGSLSQRLAAVDRAAHQVDLDRNELRSLFRAQTPVFDRGLLQHRARRKPLGYAGDYLLIDLMYRQARDGDCAIGAAWDDFYHRQAAAGAVRNRKAYFVSAIESAAVRLDEIDVLNVACGPCREVTDAVARLDLTRKGLTFHNVDIESEALAYGRTIVPGRPNVEYAWECRNAFRLRPPTTYDLVWCAGLFDYLSDKMAAVLLRRMWAWTADGGRLIVGNFHPRNPTALYMKWCMEWDLVHRSEENLLALAARAGIPPDAVHVDSEPLGVCVFLIAERPVRETSPRVCQKP